MMHRILVVDDLHPAFMQGLDDWKITYDYFPAIQRAQILEIIHQYTVLVVRTKIQVDREILDAATSLKVIARAGSGMDNIDTVCAEGKGIACINAPEANKDAVAEHAIGLILSLTRNIGRSHTEVKELLWRRAANRGVELNALTIAIIGYGNTGSALARKLSGFGSRVIFYDKYLKGVTTPWATEAFMQEVFEAADIVSFHIPLEGDNGQIINSQWIDKFRKPFYLLNLSRGGIMNTSDIIAGLKSGKILGCALDVLENEQLNQLQPKQQEEIAFLLQQPNVVITPHIAGWTYQSYERISEVLLLKLRPMLI